MADVLTALKPGGPLEPQLGALRSVLRSSYATGRSSAAVLFAVLTLAASPEAPTSVRVLAYEIAWTVVASADAGAYRRLLSLARSDSLNGDHPDLMLMALWTIASAPPRHAPSLLGSGEDTDRQMADAITGDAPPHVRAASVGAFARIAATAWLQVSGARGLQPASDEHFLTRAAGYSASAGGPFNWKARDRAVRVMFERSAEVLRACAASCEDPDPDVSEAGFRSLRGVWEACLGSGAGTSSGPGGSVPGDRLARELLRRIASRLPALITRASLLRPSGKAAASRALSIACALLLTDGGPGSGRLGPGGLADAPTAPDPSWSAPRVRQEAGGGSSSSLAGGLWGTDGPTPEALTCHLVTSLLLPSLSPAKHGLGPSGATSHPGAWSDPRGQTGEGGSGTGAAPGSSASGGDGGVNDASATTGMGSNAAAAAASLEAARCLVQLASTFCLVTGTPIRESGPSLAQASSQSASGGSNLLARYSAGAGAVSDLFAACGLPACDAAGAAPSAGASSHDGADGAGISSLGAACGEGFDAAAGPLWHMLSPSGRRPHPPHPSPLALTALLRAHAPEVVAAVAKLAARVSATGGPLLGGAAGVVTATAGYDPPGVRDSTGWGGLGHGGGSALTPTPTLHTLCSLLIGAAALLPLPALVHVSPAILREVCRLPDAGDAVGAVDPGAGWHHSLPRVALSMRLLGMLSHAILWESGYAERAAAAAASTSVGLAEPPSPHGLSLVIARVIHAASRPLAPTHAAVFEGVGSAGGGANAPSAAASSLATSPHALETSAVSTRARAELCAAALQTLVRSAPSGYVWAALGRQDAGAAPSADPGAFQTTAAGGSDGTATECPPYLLDPTGAARAHLWLSMLLDTSGACLWLVEHRLTHGGIAGWCGGDASVPAALARILGQPDALAPVPAPPPTLPPLSLYGPDAAAGMAAIIAAASLGSVGGAGASGAGGGDGAKAAAAAAAAAASAASSSVNPSLGPSGGPDVVTGWGWMREYEAVTEASDCLLNALCAAASLLFPPPGPASYSPLGHVAPSASLQHALAAGLLPPRPLLLHRVRFQRLLYCASRADLGVIGMYDRERAAAALAPKVVSAAAAAAAAAASANTGASSGGSGAAGGSSGAGAGSSGGGIPSSASATRGSAYELLPSAIPLQLRLLWLLTSAWDGSDGMDTVAVESGFGGESDENDAEGDSEEVSHTLSLDPSAVHSRFAWDGGSASVTVPSLLRSLPLGLTIGARQRGATGSQGGHRAVVRSRASTSAIDGRGGASSSLSPSLALVAEVSRQKRLVSLLTALAAEASMALGLGPDLEAAAARAAEVAQAMSAAAAAAAAEEEAEGAAGATAGAPAAISATSASATAQPAKQPQPASPPSFSSSSRALGIFRDLAALGKSESSAAPPAASAGAGGAAAAAQLMASLPKSSVAWMRGSKIGKALGFFGDKSKGKGAAAAAAAAQLAAALSSYSGEGTVVSYAHFWLLLDMVGTLAAVQRCTALQAKRAVEALLVQPKLSPDVAHTLHTLLPRVCLFAAAYGASPLARLLAASAGPEVEDVPAAPSTAVATSPQGKSAGSKGAGTGGGKDEKGGAAAEGAAKLPGFAGLAPIAAKLKLAGKKAKESVSAQQQEQQQQQGEDATAASFTTSAAPEGALSPSHNASAFTDTAPTAVAVVVDEHTRTGAALRAAYSTSDMLEAVAGEARFARSDPCALTLYAPPQVIGKHAGGRGGGMEEPAAGEAASAAAAMAGIAAVKQALSRAWASAATRPNDSTAGWYALAVAADMAAPTITALVAVASAPDLAQNAALGLNRSAASGARMRTVPPVAALHGSHAPASGVGLWRGLSLSGNVPLRQTSHTAPQPLKGAAQTILTAPLARTRAPLPPPQPPLFPALSSAPVVLSSSNDPFTITVGHSVVRVASGATSARPARLILHVSVTNATRMRLGPGALSISVQLGGALAFPRSAVTSALIATSASRLGAGAADAGGSAGGAGGYNGGAMGSASSGGVLAGDLLQLQRGSQHHATHGLRAPLPPDATLTLDSEVAVSGFGAGTVRVVVRADAVEPIASAGDDTGADDGKRLAASTRTVGATVTERSSLASAAGGDGDGEDDDEVDWTGVGAASGGATGGWGRELEVGAVPATGWIPDPDAEAALAAAASSLVWIGPGLSAVKIGRRRQMAARLLPGMPKLTKRILVTRQAPGGEGIGDIVESFALAPGADAAGGGISPSRSPVKSAIGSSSRRISAFYSGSGDGGGDRQGGGAGGALADDDDGEGLDDGATTAAGDGGTDAPGGDGGDEGEGDEGEGDATGGLDAGGAFTHRRAYRLTRLEVCSEIYRLPAVVSTALLSPLAMPEPWAVALASSTADGSACDTHCSVGRADDVLLACAISRLPYGHYASAQLSGAFAALPPTGLRCVVADATAGVWAPLPSPPGAAAFSARTAAGGTIAFVMQPQGAAFPGRVAVSFHTDDARLRAAITGDGGALAEAVAALSAGALQLVAHSNERLVVDDAARAGMRPGGLAAVLEAAVRVR